MFSLKKVADLKAREREREEKGTTKSAPKGSIFNTNTAKKRSEYPCEKQVLTVDSSTATDDQCISLKKVDQPQIDASPQFFSHHVIPS